MCRKVNELPGVGGGIEVWGDGQQTDPFCTSMNVLKLPVSDG